MAAPGEGVDFTDAAALADIVNTWTTPYAATEEMHDEAAWNAVP